MIHFHSCDKLAYCLWFATFAQIKWWSCDRALIHRWSWNNFRFTNMTAATQNPGTNCELPLFNYIYRNETSRKYQRLILRLRAVHYGLLSHLLLVGKRDYAICNDCSTKEIASNVVLRCPAYEEEFTTWIKGERVGCLIQTFHSFFGIQGS